MSTFEDRLRKLFGDRLAPDGSLVRENFARWYGPSALRDATGGPLILYRGMRRVPGASQYVTRCGRATTSWTTDPAAASVYARQDLTRSWGPGSNVEAAYIAMRRPLDLTSLAESASLWDVVSQLNWDFTEPDFDDDRVGWASLAAGLRDLDSIVDRTNAHWEIDIEPEFTDNWVGWVRTFDDLADMIERWGEDGLCSHIEYALMQTQVDVYSLADSRMFVQMLRERGFDGMVLKDAFHVGAKFYDGDRSLLDRGDEGPVIDTYRPFDQCQIKSAIGNCGLFDPESIDPCDRHGASQEAIENAPRERMRA